MNITNLTIALFVVLALDVLVTIVLLKSSAFTQNQKKSQLLIIWFLPILGASLIYIFIREDKKAFRIKKINNSGTSLGPPGTGSGGA